MTGSHEAPGGGGDYRGTAYGTTQDRQAFWDDDTAAVPGRHTRRRRARLRLMTAAGVATGIVVAITALFAWLRPDGLPSSLSAPPTDTLQSSGPLPTGNVTPPGTTTAAASTLVQASPDAARIKQYAFYSDHIRVRVNDAEHLPSKRRPGRSVVDVQINVRNGTTHRFDPGGIKVSVLYGPDRDDASLIAHDSFGGPMAPATERFADWQFLIPTPDVDRLQIVVTPSAGHEAVVFRGAAVADV